MASEIGSGNTAASGVGSGNTIATVAFHTNPFEGNINPSDQQNGFKLYCQGTKEREVADRVEIAQQNATDFMEKMRSDSSDFCWGTLVHRIAVDDNTPATCKSILRNFKDITLDHVKKAAYITWGNKLATFLSDFPDDCQMKVEDISPTSREADKEVFFKRVKSQMIAKRIKGSITEASWKSLMNKKKHFKWTKSNGDIDNDGPTILYILIC